nr:macro domain-containing protein [Chryseobacterium lathyri]
MKAAFEKMLLYSSSNNINKISLPKIGAGLGGLDWNDIKRIIEKLSEKYPQIDLLIVENYKIK